MVDTGGEPSRLREERVLVVDDDDGSRSSMQEILALAGFRVEGAEDGVVALERLEFGRFDAMVLDVNMPRLGGLELLTHLDGASPPVVLVSADERPSEEIARLPRVVTFLRKPIHARDLIAAVNRVVES